MENTNHYLFAVVEDMNEARETIIKIMGRYKEWNCVCDTAYYHEASEKIRQLRPHLLFLDYSILGGNSFMLLNEIEAMADYDPYIVFFTGYMSEQPEIAEHLWNRYKALVKMFLNKPIFEKLDQDLKSILPNAITHYYHQPRASLLWIDTITNQKIHLEPRNIICFSQPKNSRNKIIHITKKIGYEIRANWQFCEEITRNYDLKFEYANTRKALVNMEKITSMKRPFVWLNNDLKVDVAKERWAVFIQYMDGHKSNS